jgi:hypothetical protein
MNLCGGNGGITPTILNLVTPKEVSGQLTVPGGFTTEESFRGTESVSDSGGPHSQAGYFGEETALVFAGSRNTIPLSSNLQALIRCLFLKFFLCLGPCLLFSRGFSKC